MNFVIESSLNKFIIKNMGKTFILFVLVFALAETANSQNLIQSNFTGVMGSLRRIFLYNANGRLC